jgi:hypothetical protein
VSVSRMSGLLVRLYPPAWRARYGEELAALIVESSGGERVPWRVRADVALGAARERLRAAGLVGDGSPGDRVRGGALLALCAWALFVVAGAGMEKVAEHWQDATPSASRALPSTAFDGLVIAAVCGSLLVLAGIGSAIPSLAAFLRAGGWPAIRDRVVRAALLTGVAIAATVALVVWAHGLTGLQRNGNDVAYGIAFVTWALLVAVCLFAWTAAAVVTARRLRLPVATLRSLAWIASGVAAAMGVMTAATAVWWAAIADAAPWFLAGRPVGASASPLAPQLLAIGAVMLFATVVGAAGAQRAMRALPVLSDQRPTR